MSAQFGNLFHLKILCATKFNGQISSKSHKVNLLETWRVDSNLRCKKRQQPLRTWKLVLLLNFGTLVRTDTQLFSGTVAQDGQLQIDTISLYVHGYVFLNALLQLLKPSARSLVLLSEPDFWLRQAPPIPRFTFEYNRVTAAPLIYKALRLIYKASLRCRASFFRLSQKSSHGDGTSLLGLPRLYSLPPIGIRRR